MLLIILVLSAFLVASNGILQRIAGENARSRQFLSDWYAFKADCLSSLLTPTKPNAGRIARELARCEEGFSKIGDSPMLERMQRIDRLRGPDSEVLASWDELRSGFADLVRGLSGRGSGGIEALLAHSEAFEAEVGERIRIISRFEDSQGQAFDTLQLSLVLAILALVGLGIWTSLSARRAEDANRNMQSILDATYRAQEAERRRIALDLHDSIAQDLSASLMAARRLGEGSEGERANLVGMLKSTIEEVRRISWEMRPPEFDRLGFRGALLGYIDDFARIHGLRIRMEESGWTAAGLGDEVAIHVYRIVQEALVNIQRHAKAQMIGIAFFEGADRLGISIEDDGLGFDSKAELGATVGAGHLGLAGMRERARIIEAKLAITSLPGGGTKFYLEVPRGA